MFRHLRWRVGFALLAILGSGAPLTAQKAESRTFGKWEATLQRNLMTDAVLGGAAQITDSTSHVDLGVTCTSGRLDEIHFTLGDLYGDSTTTIQLRFDATPPIAPVRWTRRLMATDAERDQARSALTSSIAVVRELARSVVDLVDLVFFERRDADARALRARLTPATRLRVEFTPGGNARSQVVQAEFAVGGLREALAWMRCTR